MSTISPLEHTAIGALAGVTEVTLMQPTVALKNALQEGRPIPRSLPALYRGLLVRRLSNFCWQRLAQYFFPQTIRACYLFLFLHATAGQCWRHVAHMRNTVWNE
jgi:hypothetical protein